jgi:serine/threonine protein kinase
MNLEDKYPGTDPRGLHILSQMLQFNPERRITAEDALKDPYFDDIRLPDQETFNDDEEAHCDIDLRFDDKELSMDELRTLIIEEIDKSKQSI